MDMLRSSFAQVGLVLALLLALHPAPVRAWQSSHGDPTNTGFADVKTLPAKTAPITVPNIGNFAPGVSPVVAPDGTVYIGNLEGKLLAFRPDGKPAWQRDISFGYSIHASPTIGSDGTIYVVGSRSTTDASVTPTIQTIDTELNAFVPGGGWRWHVSLPSYTSGGAGNAPPNIWHYQGEDVVMVPLTYRNRLTGGYDTRLFAVTPGGAVIGEAHVGSVVPTTTSTSASEAWLNLICMPPPISLLCQLTPGFTVPGSGPPPPYRLPPNLPIPQPGVAIFTYPGGGTPFILASDGFNSLVGLTFDAHVFTEIFRVTDSADHRTMLSPPMTLPDGHTLISTEQGLRFAGPNMSPAGTIHHMLTQATPTRLPDGRVILSMRDGLTIIDGTTVAGTIPLEGESMVPAAASRTHLFVSTENAFLTFDVHTLERVAEINWAGGGQVAPAIGPTGYVYAMASNILFVFPPSRFTVPADAANQTLTPVGGGGTSNIPLPDGTVPNGTVPEMGTAQPQDLNVIQPAQVDPGAQLEPGAQPEVATVPPAGTADPAATSQRFDEPMTANGNRVSACSDADGKHCGKSVAKAFCQAQGFTGVSDIDVDDRKVTAETLDGQLCTKKKCAVFGHVTCSR
jgi:hypothetical protein